jgi:hypothetical protein
VTKVAGHADALGLSGHAPVGKRYRSTIGCRAPRTTRQQDTRVSQTHAVVAKVVGCNRTHCWRTGAHTGWKCGQGVGMQPPALLADGNPHRLEVWPRSRVLGCNRLRCWQTGTHIGWKCGHGRGLQPNAPVANGTPHRLAYPTDTKFGRPSKAALMSARSTRPVWIGVRTPGRDEILLRDVRSESGSVLKTGQHTRAHTAENATRNTHTRTHTIHKRQLHTCTSKELRG